MHPYKTLDQIKNTCGLFLQTYSALGDLFPFLKHLIFKRDFNDKVLFYIYALCLIEKLQIFSIL